MTRRSTLESSNSFFSGIVASDCCSSNEFFIDRDPTVFRHVLNWMRGVRHLPEDDDTLRELAWEADYYSLEDMREAIQKTPRRFSLLKNSSDAVAEMRRR